MRLIDADVLIEAMKKTETEYENAMTCPSWWSAFNVISEQPTAYDIDKVVEELETNKQNALEVEESIKEYNVWNKAIEIVKHGGVAEDCNKCANYTEPDEIDNGCYLCCKGYENNYKSKADNGGVSDDVCEWQSYYKFVSDKYKRVTSCGYEFYDLHHAVPFKFCPYCGKKIKVVE